MPYIEKSQLQIEIEQAEEREYLALAREAEDRRREHELKLAKLKYATQPRYRSIERSITIMAKSPALIVGLIVIGVLTVKGKELPAVLVKFMTL